MDVSIAICTWNRADLLDQTLNEMRKLRIPDGTNWELLVVNNNCTDHTEQVIAKHSHALPLKHLKETKAGLSHARNCAVDVAKGQLLLWTDDDVLVDREWMATYIHASRDFPEADFFGGTVIPWFEVEPPKWLKKNFAIVEGAYAARDLGQQIREFDPGELPVGANMAFRMTAVRDMRYDPSLGRVKDRLTSGDETDFVERLTEKGGRGVWVGPAEVRHFIPSPRMSKAYLRDLYTLSGQTYIRRKEIGEAPLLFGVPRWIFRQYVSSVLMTWLTGFTKGRAWMRAFVKSSLLKGAIKESRRQWTAARRQGAVTQGGDRMNSPRGKPFGYGQAGGD